MFDIFISVFILVPMACVAVLLATLVYYIIKEAHNDF